MTWTINPDSKRYATRRAVLALCDMDMTSNEVAAELKMPAESARRNLAALHADNLIHICGWETKVGSPGDMSAIYRAGAGVDKARPPKKKLRRATQARYYQKNAAITKARRVAQQGPPNVFAALMQGAR